MRIWFLLCPGRQKWHQSSNGLDLSDAVSPHVISSVEFGRLVRPDSWFILWCLLIFNVLFWYGSCLQPDLCQPSMIFRDILHMLIMLPRVCCCKPSMPLHHLSPIVGSGGWRLRGFCHGGATDQPGESRISRPAGLWFIVTSMEDVYPWIGGDQVRE